MGEERGLRSRGRIEKERKREKRKRQMGVDEKI